MGIERVVALIEQAGSAPAAAAADVYLVAQGEAALRAAMGLAGSLRERAPQRRIELNLGGGNFKAQFRRADRSGAPLAIVLGEDELARGMVQLKPLREGLGEPAEVALETAVVAVGEWFATRGLHGSPQ
jgi:histidyl-tRNA synthetase